MGGVSPNFPALLQKNMQKNRNKYHHITSHAEERAVEYAEGSRTPLFEICHQILSKLLVNREAISFYLGMEVIESGNARHRVWAVLLLSNPVAIPIFHKDHNSPSNNRHVDSKKCNLVSKTAIEVSCT